MSEQAEAEQVVLTAEDYLPADTSSEEVSESSVYEDAPSEDTLALLNSTEEVEPTKVEEVKPPEVTKEEEDPKFSKAFVKLSKREKELATEAERIKATAAKIESYEAAAENFSAQPIEFLKAQIAAFSKSDDPDEIDAYFHELYDTLTMHMLGVDAPKEMQEQSEFQKFRRQHEADMKKLQDEKLSLEEAALEAQREAKVEGAKNTINNDLSAAAADFPYLLNQTEESPGDLVFDLVWKDYNAQLEAGREDPQPMSIEEAANLANNHFKELAQRWASIIPASAKPTQQSTGQPATNRPGNSRTLTNSSASIAPTSAASSYIEDDEESKFKAMELLNLI